MLKNYLIQDDLKGYHPALENLLRQGETNFSKQKSLAEKFVLNNFLNKGYDVKALRSKLILSIDTTILDLANRSRVVIDVESFNAGAVLNVLGCNTENGDYEVCGTITISATGQLSFLLTEMTKYYKYETTGTIVINECFIVESNFDDFYAFYWLYLIFRDQRNKEGDAWDILSQDYYRDYNSLWNKIIVSYDTDLDGINSTDEGTRTNSIIYLR